MLALHNPPTLGQTLTEERLPLCEDILAFF